MVRPRDGDTSPAAPPGWGVGVRAEVHGSRHGREGGIGLNPIAALTRRKRSGESKGGCTDLIMRYETGRLLTSSRVAPPRRTLWTGAVPSPSLLPWLALSTARSA